MIAVVYRMAYAYPNIMPNSNRGSTGFQSNEFEQEYDRPSKSQLKREMTALQKLGAELVAEPQDRVLRVPMPDDVRDAILECQSIKDHEGRRRQMQYVGKKMRSAERRRSGGDPAKPSTAGKAPPRPKPRLCMRWSGSAKNCWPTMTRLTELRTRHPELDMQHLRTLIRNARREQAESKPPKAYREIFQMLEAIADSFTYPTGSRSR